MINSGILNPQILSLLARVRHTNALVIADRGFPFWPMIETVDVSVVDDLPTVLQLIAAARANHNFTQAFQAGEFLKNNTPAVRAEIRRRAERRADDIRAACGIQKARAARHRPHPHRRHGAIREHDFDFRLVAWRCHRRQVAPPALSIDCRWT